MGRLRCLLGPDAAGPELCSAIAQSTKRITASFYQLGPSYVWPFVDAIKAGASVNLLLDGRPAGNLEAAQDLIAAGAQVSFASPPHAYVHWKIAVLDDADFVLGTGNLIEIDAPYRRHDKPKLLQGTREWWMHASGLAALCTSLRQRVEQAAALGTPLLGLVDTAAAAAGAVGTPKPQVAALDVEVEPEKLDLAISGAAALDQFQEQLDLAKQRIWITVPYVFTAGEHVRSLLDAVVAAAAADKRLLLGGAPHPSDLAALRARGLAVRVMNVERCTRGHAKGAVLDGSVIVGSSNWSEPGLSSNFEAALRVDQAEAADYFGAAFERDWAQADA